MFGSNAHYSSACISGNTLVLSLPDARIPVVWRMDLLQAKASALEVRDMQGQKEGGYMLVLKTPRGDVNEIAVYDSREQAVALLMRVTKALQNDKPGMRGGDGVPGVLKSLVKWFAIASVILIAVIVILNIVALLGPQRVDPSMYSPSNLEQSQGTPSSSGGRGASGVPMSADDFLSGQ